MQHLTLRTGPRPRYHLLALTCLLLLAQPAWAKPDPLDVYAHPQKLVRLPDGRRMNLYCVGKKGPVVLFDSGFGGSTFAWGDVQARLDGRFRACAYDRAGSGFSDPGPMPRDSRHIVEDLRALAKAAHLPQPYILVGHSMGGLNMRLYASQHPKEVAGLVLVDPSGEYQDARLNRALGLPAPTGDPMAKHRACVIAAKAGLTPGTPDYDNCVGTPPKTWPEAFRKEVTRRNLTAAYHQALVSEFENLAGADSEQIEHARHSLGDLPLIVLTAENTYRDGVPPADADRLSATWRQMHDEVAALSTRGVNRLVVGSGHQIPSNNPAAVATAIADVAAMSHRP